MAAAGLERRARRRLPEYDVPVHSLEVPTSIGPVRVGVYRPRDVDESPAVHVNFHGGGYVLAITAIDDPICRTLAALTGSVVLNVDYAVAPRHRFPAPPHQAYEVVRWVADHGHEHGWDSSRLTVGGQSAGGGLAAAVARLAFEDDGPALALQVLHYPPLDLTVPVSQKRSLVARPVLRPWMGEVYDTAYAPDPATRADRLVSPAGAADTADLTGIAPAVVIAAEYDVLRDEARRYGDRLRGFGALVEYREVPGADHGYDVSDDLRARKTYAFIADHLRVATAR